MSHHFYRVALVILFVIPLLSLGCKGSKEKGEGHHQHQGQDQNKQQEQQGQGHEHHKHHHHHGGEAPATGTPSEAKPNVELDPPIAKADVPKGAWYCDMGTVHYYRTERGDGKCPVCGMLLTENH